MNDYITEREIQRKREYHREWRKKHPESVKAAQMRYWTKKAAEMEMRQEHIVQDHDTYQQ